MEAEAGAGDDVTDRLSWVGRLLLPEVDPTKVTVTDEPAPGARSVLSFRALPSADRPYLLTPLGSRGAESGAVHHIGNPRKRTLRVAESALSVAFRTGVAQRLLNDRLHVVVADPTIEIGATLIDRVGTVLGRDDVNVAVILGRDRPNRKPVLKVLDDEGDVVAFVKVGWNEISRALVRHEAEALERLASEADDLSFGVPTVIAFEPGERVDLLVVTPIPQGSGLRGGPPTRAPMRATREVASRAGVTLMPLGRSPYWRELSERLDATSDDGVSNGAQTAALELLERQAGGRELPFGSWHGDWTPWNMTRADGRLFVWDWERARDGVPVGADLMHFDFDVRVKIDGRTPERAIRESMQELGPRLETLGVPSGLVSALGMLHLLEMSLRFREARAAGLDVEDHIYGPALASAVESRSSRPA